MSIVASGEDRPTASVIQFAVVSALAWTVYEAPVAGWASEASNILLGCVGSAPANAIGNTALSC